MKRKELKERLQAYSKAFSKISNKNRLLKSKLLQQRRKGLKNLEEGTYIKCLKKVFTKTQIKALLKENVRSKTKWDNVTLKKCLKLKFACGTPGYDELLKQNFPLPSHRTLRRRVQGVIFKPGIQQDIFEFLKIKIEHFSDERERDCCLILDEMSIIPGKMYDVGSKGYIGFVSLGEGSSTLSTLATHALVFMLAGVNSRWKQTVGYHLTGDSVKGNLLAKEINDILIKATRIGLNVISVTSDMGSSNQAFWKEHNIIAGRYSEIKNFFPHPSDTTLNVYVIADPVHLFKNIRSTFLNNQTVELPPEVMQKNKLVHQSAQSSHLNDLVQYQEQLRFKLAPKLHEEDLTPSHFATMKVSSASHVISHSVSSGLKYLAEELKRPEYLTTAWFLDQIEKWFKLMSSRHPVFALSKINSVAYGDAIQFLESFINLFKDLKFGQKGSWKPCQKGVLISTTSILEIQKLCLEERNYQFLLTGRFTQDCVENLFSLVRTKQAVPNPLQFKSNLKIIMLSQYMKDVSKGSYEMDEREDFSDYLDLMKTKEIANKDEKLPLIVPENVLTLNQAEKNVLYSISGYIISSMKKTNTVCVNCLGSVGGYTPYNLEYEKLTEIKRFKDKTLFFCNEETFNFIFKLESIFSNCMSVIDCSNVAIRDFILEKMKAVAGEHILKCHSLREKLINRYLTFRLKINSNKKFFPNRSTFSSKSMNLYARHLM